ncbi:carbamoyl-phosphate synthase large subunit [Campylobacter sp. 19-13652]|uniref:carbamoyl-phosphate synthase large subunit n=1 Tax=Campylobacter sp. 19-13652 TaxID=2840180 RepID=UPI001C78D835|nr:carbamoyl-phosphate synthase large subunit [Campylobacter sp. 19-13652]BCX78697.1 carbamoyl-phosphate synthase large chain [Campylobacter sp. 19-13652]
MPKRTDINTILLIGSGPIVIGQACEFDYSGTQAAKTLKELGYRVVLINSNPATIMTDPDFADATYIEPITKESILNIIKKEHVDAILPTMGGQVALNVAMQLYESGELGAVKFIGANPEAIKKGEDRVAFKEAMIKIGMDLPRSAYAYTMDEALKAADEIGFPLIIRASFTLGGGGSGVAYNIDEFREIAAAGIEASPIDEILIEESLLGWKEYEMEVIRDYNDNCIIVCSIENFDPMGVHTGDSITIAPALTLTDKEYQAMRDASFAVLREIGVDTGGSNVQFAINPKNGRMTIIEMNPRVSRSSALASKATGYPIAKVATLLAVGFSLDEIKNDITGTPASFEPVIDYIVTKIPRFTFEKFKGVDERLGTAMKSVGEVMAIGASFKESVQKALCSLERDYFGFNHLSLSQDEIIHGLRNANEKRILIIAQAFREGMSVEQIHELSGVDPWFLSQIKEIVEFEARINMDILNDAELMRRAKVMGFSDEMIAYLINLNDGLGSTQNDVYYARKELGVSADFREVDTCAGEFAALTPYLYSSTSPTPIAQPSTSKQGKSVLIIGGGPNRIGQGIEFDYCCVQASFALRDMGVKSIMYNCNPETVSTDYDTSDVLYFEPIDFEHLRAVIERERPDGVIVHFGGQTPLKYAKKLTAMGAKIIGTSARVIDVAEDRKKFSEFICAINVKQPQNATATSEAEAVIKAAAIGYPVLVRPSYVLGGRAMRRVYSESELREYMSEAVSVSHNSPVLIDKFLQDATELDVDAISDGKDVFVGAIMEHIEEAGIHSGDSASILPPLNLSDDLIEQIYTCTKEIALNLGVVGLMNIQYAIYENELYIIEVNPRASRTVPFVSKAIGLAMAKIATRVMWQGGLKEAIKFYDTYGVLYERNDGILTTTQKPYICVKESVFPFNKLSGADPILSPEMKSTGEVMGISKSFELSFAKAQIASQNALPKEGKVLLTLADADKIAGIALARELSSLGFSLVATGGTHKALKAAGIECEAVYKISEARPNVEDALKNRQIALVINTSDAKSSASDGAKIRQLVLRLKVPYFTNLRAASVAIRSISAMQKSEVNSVGSLQEYLSLR